MGGNSADQEPAGTQAKTVDPGATATQSSTHLCRHPTGKSVVAVAVGRLAYGSTASFLNGGLASEPAPESPGGVAELNRQTDLIWRRDPSLRLLAMDHVTASPTRPAAALAPLFDS